MKRDLDGKRPQEPADRSQTPLWFAAGGLAVALYSRGMKDEAIGDIVFLLGVACAIAALLYWVFRPRHGL